LNFRKTKLDGVILVEPDVHRDERGFFLETFHAEKYAQGGIAASFVQANHSKSVRGTLRGLHAQWRRPQGKLVRCLQGEIFDVAVDMRRGSPTHGEWVGGTLSSENHHQLYVPPGFLHGFVVLSDVAEVEYLCTDLYDPGYELGVRWDDPEIGVAWPVPAAEIKLSVKDKAAPFLADAPREQVPTWFAR
jgi:dTDP-4-dehydrorhamnose 3,5-epimerase